MVILAAHLWFLIAGVRSGSPQQCLVHGSRARTRLRSGSSQRPGPAGRRDRQGFVESFDEVFVSMVSSCHEA